MSFNPVQQEASTKSRSNVMVSAPTGAFPDLFTVVCIFRILICFSKALKEGCAVFIGINELPPVGLVALVPPNCDSNYSHLKKQKRE
jgi:hypothetical protein